jgi:hypothetical protein
MLALIVLFVKNKREFWEKVQVGGMNNFDQLYEFSLSVQAKNQETIQEIELFMEKNINSNKVYHMRLHAIYL